MRRIIIYSLLIISIVSTLVALVACGKVPNGNLVSVVIIGGIHANKGNFEVPRISFQDGNIFDAEDRIIDIVGVVVDGKPFVNYIDNAESDNGKNYTRENFDRVKQNRRWDTAQNYLIDFVEKFSTQPAMTDEVDTLEALHIAQNAISQMDQKSKKRILIYDSGLCTTGALNFLSNKELKSCISGDHIITNEEIQMVIDKLSNSLEIPKLKDVSIFWYGLGLVGGEQLELNKKSRNNLKNIWKKIIEQSGATVKFIDVNMLPEDFLNERETLPLVSVVLFEESVKLDVDALGFEPNSCEFRAGTEEQRKRILKKYTNEAFNNNILSEYRFNSARYNI